MRHDEALAKFKDEEMLPPGITYMGYEMLVQYLYHEYLDSDVREDLQRLIIRHAIPLRLVNTNEAAYFMTQLDEGLETIRERFWENLK